MARKSFSGNAAPTTLSGGGISPTDLSIGVTAITNFPNTAVGPFIVTIDRGQGTLEEKVKVTSYAGTTLTVASIGDRGWDGTTAQSHTGGASVVCTLDADTINLHETYMAGNGTVTPTASAVSDSGANGSSAVAAAADHKHAREGFATGASTASAPADASADGTSVHPARADHKHARESVATLVADVSPSILGLPLALTGATAATRYVGGTTSGAPASGTFAIGDFVIDRSGTVWICTVAGTSGTWVTPYPVGNPAGRIYVSSGGVTSGGGSIVSVTFGAGTTGTTFTKGGMTVNNTTGGTGLVVPVAGVYQVNGMFKVTNASPTTIEAAIGKNNTAVSIGNNLPVSTASYQSVVVSDLIQCAANDVLNLMYASSATALAFQNDGPGQSNYLSVHLVSQ